MNSRNALHTNKNKLKLRPSHLKNSESPCFSSSATDRLTSGSTIWLTALMHLNLGFLKKPELLSNTEDQEPNLQLRWIRGVAVDGNWVEGFFSLDEIQFRP